jgi:hypothetical protein
MDSMRLLELLSYAKVCFDKCTNPFDLTHLIKKRVKSDECIDLSHQIASIIEEWIYDMYSEGYQENAEKQAEEDFKETQE